MALATGCYSTKDANGQALADAQLQRIIQARPELSVLKGLTPIYADFEAASDWLIVGDWIFLVPSDVATCEWQTRDAEFSALTEKVLENRLKGSKHHPLGGIESESDIRLSVAGFQVGLNQVQTSKGIFVRVEAVNETHD